MSAGSFGTVSLIHRDAHAHLDNAIRSRSATSCSARCARRSRSIDQRGPATKDSIPSEDRRPKSDRKLQISPCSADRPHASPCTRRAPGGCVRTLGILERSMWQPLFTYLLLGSGERNSSTAAGIQVIAARTAIQCNFRLIRCKIRVNAPIGRGCNYLPNRTLRRMQWSTGASWFARSAAYRLHPPPGWRSGLSWRGHSAIVVPVSRVLPIGQRFAAPSLGRKEPRLLPEDSEKLAFTHVDH